MAKVKQEVEIEEREAQSQPQPEQQPKGKICYGDCFACSIPQAIFCASTHARVAMRMVELQTAVVEELRSEVSALQRFASVLNERLISEELINPLDAQA